MPSSRIETLQAMPIFGGISAEVLDGLLRNAAMVTVAAGDFYFREGDKAEGMYVLESGKVSLLKHWNGVAHTLGELGAGDCFGEMALLDLFPRSASVMAVTPCTAIELSTSNLYQLFTSDVQQFALIQMNIARELSRRLRVADERLFRAHIGADEPSTLWAYVA